MAKRKISRKSKPRPNNVKEAEQLKRFFVITGIIVVVLLAIIFFFFFDR